MDFSLHTHTNLIGLKEIVFFNVGTLEAYYFIYPKLAATPLEAPRGKF